MANNTLHLQTSWDEVKEKLKEININLTDADLVYEPGKEEQLLSNLSRKMKKEPSAVKDLIESVSANKGKAS